MHTVALNPTTITLTAGGPPVTQQVTISDVADNPDDVIVSQPIAVNVAGVSVNVNTTITVDYPDDPTPVVTADSAAPATYTVAQASPVRVDATTYTVELTYTPV